MKTYIATDRRVYNGVPCSDMQREINHARALEKRLLQIDKTARCVYFPMEVKYLVFIDVNGVPKILTGNMHFYKQEALIEAIEFLERKKLR